MDIGGRVRYCGRSWGILNDMRRLVLLSSLVGVGLGFGLAQAAAQYSYPPAGYRGPAPGGAINAAPDDDDDDDIPTASPSRGSPVDSQALPPLSDRGGAPYPGSPLPRQDRPAYGAMPPYGETYVPSPYAPPPPPGYEPPPGYAASPAYAPPPGYPVPSGPYAATPPDVPRPPQAVGAPTGAAPGQVAHGNIPGLPPEDQPEVGKPKQLAQQFRRQVVPYQTKHPAGTIVIDTPSTFLYFVNGDGTAIRYGIGVGRDGFTWAGVEKVTRMAEWPDWHPPAEMIERQPYLPRFMAGGESNPLGARALYLGKTIYRVHGTNQPSTIGTFVSSGCIRMVNEDVMDLYTRVKVGTKVVVLGDGKGPPPAATAAR
jgi:lipoprotein-anchoring transpeptidase ErfK/SrfK